MSFYSFLMSVISLAFIDLTMGSVKIYLNKMSYFMQINLLIWIANQLIGFFTIRGSTERKF